jgi:hypothetical protein
MVKSHHNDVYWQILEHRKKMALARLGFAPDWRIRFRTGSGRDRIVPETDLSSSPPILENTVFSEIWSIWYLWKKNSSSQRNFFAKSKRKRRRRRNNTLVSKKKWQINGCLCEKRTLFHTYKFLTVISRYYLLPLAICQKLALFVIWCFICLKESFSRMFCDRQKLTEKKRKIYIFTNSYIYI